MDLFSLLRAGLAERAGVAGQQGAQLGGARLGREEARLQGRPGQGQLYALPKSRRSPQDLSPVL